MKEKKFSIGEFFYNDRFVLVFSVFIAVIAWFIVSSINTQERPREISDVPVVVTLSDEATQEMNLRVFSQSVTSATVSLTGDSVAVRSIDPSELRVVAEQASSITQPTSAQLRLRLERPSQVLGDYEVQIDPEYVFVEVDYYQDATFQINTDGIKYKADDSYVVSEPSLSVNEVTISGPQKEIDRISRVCVEYEIDTPLISTQTFTTNLVLYDRYGNQLSKDNLTISDDEVEVTISVRSRQTLTLEPTFQNKPSGLNLNSGIVQVDPESIQIAGPEDVLSNLTTISLEPIDFAEVSPVNNSFDVAISLPAGCSNISMIYEARVTLDLDGFVAQQFTITKENFEVVNLAANKTSDVYTQSMVVTLVGPQAQIENIQPEDIVVEINMAGRETFTGHIEMPVQISVQNASSVWAYGEYLANVNIQEKVD